MAAMVEIVAAAMPPDEDGRRAVDLFAFAPFATGGANTDLRDGNHAREVIRRICGQGITDARPPQNAEELWRVVLRITHTRRGLASYAVDYRRRPGCPLECVGEMMGIYREIKRVLRNAREGRNAN